MQELYNVMPYTGYVYPNETVLPWSVLIVNYPYMTGLVAGAFSVSSLYHVFGMTRFKPVARYALLTALGFMAFVPANLLLHLGHPERAFNTMITPHWTSAFVAFGFFAAFYVVLLAIEVWFAFREDIVAMSQTTTGLVRQFYRALSLWSDEISPRSRLFDHKWLFTLAVIGIPAAHGLHGYVGFVFGSLKSREWWGSDMMPVIFLFSAIISGMATLIVFYIVVCKVRRVKIDEECIRGLGYALWGFLMFTALLEGVEFGSLVYKAKEGIEVIMQFVEGPLLVPFFILQLGLGEVVPIVLLTVTAFHHPHGKPLLFKVALSALLVLMSVFMMRWNVVIGGQEIAKTGRGLLAYSPEFWGREGLVAVLLIDLGALGLIWLLTRVLPPWRDMEAGAKPTDA